MSFRNGPLPGARIFECFLLWLPSFPRISVTFFHFGLFVNRLVAVVVSFQIICFHSCQLVKCFVDIRETLFLSVCVFTHFWLCSLLRSVCLRDYCWLCSVFLSVLSQIIYPDFSLFYLFFTLWILHLSITLSLCFLFVVVCVENFRMPENWKWKVVSVRVVFLWNKNCSSKFYTYGWDSKFLEWLHCKKYSFVMVFFII